MNKKQNKIVKREAAKILDSLKEKVPLTGQPGKLQPTNSPINSKDRRHRGRITPSVPKGTHIKEMIEEALEPQEEWNDWIDYRDGMREMLNPKYRKYHWKKSDKVKKAIALRKSKRERWKKKK